MPLLFPVVSLGILQNSMTITQLTETHLLLRIHLLIMDRALPKVTKRKKKVTQQITFNYVCETRQEKKRSSQAESCSTQRNQLKY